VRTRVELGKTTFLFAVAAAVLEIVSCYESQLPVGVGGES